MEQENTVWGDKEEDSMASTATSYSMPLLPVVVVMSATPWSWAGSLCQVRDRVGSGYTWAVLQDTEIPVGRTPYDREGPVPGSGI